MRPPDIKDCAVDRMPVTFCESLHLPYSDMGQQARYSLGTAQMILRLFFGFIGSEKDEGYLLLKLSLRN